MKKNNIYKLIIPRFEDIFHSFFAQEIIRGASLAASHLKADLLIHITERDGTEEGGILNPKEFSTGILFADIDQNKSVLGKVASRKIPYLVLNNYFEEPLNCIEIDNYKATRRLMEYLVKLGHTRIATICGELNTQAGISRLKGYKDGLIVSGLEVEKEFIRKGEFLRTPARRAAEKLLDLKDRPTAIFAASDVMALEVIDVAKKKGIKVPEQLSVIGFDDNPLNVYSSIGLTTVRQPIAEMARLGLETLHQIAIGRQSLPFKKKLNAQLIKRQSCAEIN